MIVDEVNEMQEDTPFGKYKEDLLTVQDQLKYNNIPTLSLLFKNVWGENLSKIMIKLTNECTYICDYQLKCLLLSKGKIKYFKKKMGVYRWIRNGGESFSARNNLSGGLIALKDSFNFCLNLFEFLEGRSLYAIREKCFKAWGQILLFYLKRSDWRNFQIFFLKGLAQGRACWLLLLFVVVPKWLFKKIRTCALSLIKN
jgi:hypothetical protein